MIVSEFRDYIIKPTLMALELYSASAENLIIGTGLIESNFDHLTQMKGGVARGVFQCEKITYTDVVSYIKRDKRLHEKILSTCFIEYLPPDYSFLIWHLRLAVCICRAHYLRIKENLPQYDDAYGLAKYHKTYYNGPGKTNIDESVKVFQRVIHEEYA
jgi:hypothetical protein